MKLHVRLRVAGRSLLIGLLACVCQAALVGDAHAQGSGRIEGRLVRKDGSGVAAAEAVLSGTSARTVTGPYGEFSFGDLAPGTYEITLSLGSSTTTISGVRVAAGDTTVLTEETVDWPPRFTDDLLVEGASRQLELIHAAAIAGDLVTGPEIERKASHGQLAKLIEFTPGANVTQSGLWDFNIGTRGFNRALSRRVAVLLDGRDVSLPFFGYQGWPAFSFPLDDLASVEIVRGPNAALYGANASGGVINMTSEEPRFSPGGSVRFTAGELGTVNLEARWAGALGRQWHVRVAGGMRQSNGYAVSRVNGPEYSVTCAPQAIGDCLPQEFVPIDGEDTQIYFGEVRFDKYLANGVRLTMEGGDAQGKFGVFQVTGQRATSIGNDGRRPWARLSVKSDHFDVTTSYDQYVEPTGYMGLSTGTVFNSDSNRLQVEARTNRRLVRDTVWVIAGAAATVEHMDSFNQAAGGQSFLYRPVTSDTQALFGLGTWEITRRLTVLMAARGDWGSLYDFQFSPKSSVTYTVAPNQRVRFSYSRSFQVSNSLEYFLDAPVSPPADLSGLNAFCTPFGVDCRFGQTPVLALGNEDMKVENVGTWEVGYKGLLAGRAFLTAEYYRSRSSNLATSLLPQLGTALGRINPDFGPWSAPAGLPAAVADQVRALAPLLSNRLDGSNILAVASYTNFDQVTSEGLDLGWSYAPGAGWQADVTYSWFNLRNLDPQIASVLLPNVPPHTFGMGVSYDRNKVGGSVEWRWVDDFRWADSVFLGDVPSYTTVDLTGTYRLSRAVSVGVNVSNVFNDRHWESFGGALLSRRALASLQYHW